jgi:hypothetical protein
MDWRKSAGMVFVSAAKEPLGMKKSGRAGFFTRDKASLDIFWRRD